jgi:DNA-binding CsgD family transcriptional regulator
MTTSNEEFEAYLDLEEGLYLEHYGTPRHSGRFPWGSGENPYQHEDWYDDASKWLKRVEDYQKQGLTNAQIAEKMDCSTTQLISWKSVAVHQRQSIQISKAKEMRDQGKNNSEIARALGVSEGTVRNWFKNNTVEVNASKGINTAKFLEKQIDEKGIIDIGKGVERTIGVSEATMAQAIAIMKGDGYSVETIGIPQVTNQGKQINRTLAGKFDPEFTSKQVMHEMYKARDAGEISSVAEYTSEDGGTTWKAPRRPVSLDSSRIDICYAEQGGSEKDGLIELRRGCPDLTLNNLHYAQVRILVDNGYYLKGMAAYSDDLPEGIDIRFNTNKHIGTPMMEGKNGVLKPIKNDPDNPFGAVIQASGQPDYIDISTGEKKQSPINMVHPEGDWGDYQKTIPSQFLSKQPYDLVQRQLNYTYEEKLAEFNDIKRIENVAVKEHYLQEFASQCDSDAVNLAASAFPRQSYQVILPLTTLKDDEVYAPNYRNGEKVALVRFPHGGTFEIPILTVNNNNPEGDRLISKQAKDAIGINKTNADRLSGADFDGDDVLVIPTGKGNKIDIQNQKALEGLIGFDAKEMYGTKAVEKDGKTIYINKNGIPIKPMTAAAKGKQMGVVTNLITDMSVAGASADKLARAVRHSQTVIDAEKHHLDWKQSEIDNDIASLKKEFQTHIDKDGNVHVGGAGTLLSRSTGEARIGKTQGNPYINQKGKPWYDETLPEGALIPKFTGETKPKKGKSYIGEDGKKHYEYDYEHPELVTQKTTQMAATRDPYELSTGTKVEEEYAKYAKRMKDMANEARKEMVYLEKEKVNPTAAKVYAPEVASLKAKLNNAIKQAPKEAYAQVLATAEINRQHAMDPSIDIWGKEDRKNRQRAIENARARVGSNRANRNFEITDREWEAIQARAVSYSTLKEILKYTDADELRQRATPRTNNRSGLSQAQIDRIKAMYNNKIYTISQIADVMGVSTSTISNVIKEA